jgi:UDP:flavonoid glycosyltransferase YjiC (YdhE family)
MLPRRKPELLAGVDVRLLGVSLPGEGHLNPLLPLLRAAQADGHAVAVATSRSYVEDVESGGVPGLAAGPDFRFDQWPQIWPELANVPPAEQELWWPQTVSRDVTPGLARAVTDLVGSWGADALLAEYAAAPAAGIAAELSGVPMVGAAWAVEPGYDAQDAGVTGLDDVRAACGLARLGTRGVFVGCERVLSFLPPSWGALDGPPLQNTRRVRIPAVGKDTLPPDRLLAGVRPRVYATLGTVYGSVRLLRAIIAAIDAGGWAGVVTVSRRLDAARFEAPVGVVVEQYVPQGAVLPQCDAVLCHGGLGTLLGALDEGLPMVIIPLGSDQLWNADRAERLGVARVVAPEDVSVATLQAALEDVLTESRYREAALSLRRELQQMDSVEDAVSSLSDWLQRR